MYDLGYGPHSHVSLCSISISSMAVEHLEVYFLANDLIVVMFSRRTYSYFQDLCSVCVFDPLNHGFDAVHYLY